MADVNTELQVHEQVQELKIVEEVHEIVMIKESDTQVVVSPVSETVVIEAPAPEKVTYKTETEIQIVEVAKQGPPGIQGEKGERGVSAIVFEEELFVVDSLTQQRYNLLQVPLAKSLRVEINGLKQLPTDFILEGKEVLLKPSAAATVGDLVTFSYSYEGVELNAD